MIDPFGVSAGRKVVVIGAGFGGLAAAIRLQARGFQVTLVEKRDAPGGRAYVYRDAGFSFDGGPTVITAPFLFEELFAARRQAHDGPPDSWCRSIRSIASAFTTAACFDYNGDAERMAAEVAQVQPRRRRRLSRASSRSRRRSSRSASRSWATCRSVARRDMAQDRAGR